MTAKREQDGRQLRGRVGMREAAANRAAVSNHAMRDEAHGGAQKRAYALNKIRIFDGCLARERLDCYTTIPVIDPVQARYAIDVHDVGGAGETEVEQRDERLAAGEHLRVL